MNDSLTLFTGLIFFVIGLLFKILPTKKINSIYGYRTASSMRNIDTWRAANKYSAVFMILEGIGLMIIGLIIPKFAASGATGTGITVGILILFIIVLFVATEKHLHRNFDNDGQRRIT